MEFNRKSAPQQRVTEIIKTGEWSKIQYLHKLECGHIETRKRAATTEKIACIGCVRVGRAEEILTSLARPVIIDPPIEEAWIDNIGEEIANTEQQVGSVRAGVASALGLSTEMIDVVMEQGEEGIELSYVVVFLDAETAQNIASRGRKIIDI